VKDTPLTAEESLALLRENAQRLGFLTDGLPAARLHTAPSQLAKHERTHVRQIERTLSGNRKEQR
jgi:hypothetical protein